MRTETALKLGQVAGVLLLGAGVAAHLLRAEGRTMSLLLLAGLALYGGCRLAAWLRRKD